MPIPGGVGTALSQTWQQLLPVRRIGFYHGVGGWSSGPSLCPTPNTRESGHLAYKDAPFGVCAPVLLGTTICSIVKPGALRDYPALRVPWLLSFLWRRSWAVWSR